MARGQPGRDLRFARRAGGQADVAAFALERHRTPGRRDQARDPESGTRAEQSHGGARLCLTTAHALARINCQPRQPEGQRGEVVDHPQPLQAERGAQRADAEALRNFQGLQAANARVTLDVRRDGKPLQLNVALKEGARSADGASLDPRLAGATLKEMDESARQAVRGMIRGAQGGVQVGNVARDSRAWNSGLRPGDIIVASSSGEFGDLPGFRASFERKPAQLVLNILRGRGTGRLLMQ